MLIEFRVENHRSLKTEQVLTMEAGRVDGDATIPRAVPGYSKPLLPVAALYGANASGKSNVLSALEFMCIAVIDSHRKWEPNEGIPRDPFAWGSTRSAPSMYECNFLTGGIRYRYGFVVSDNCVEEEWLHAWPKGKQQTWFEREGQRFTFGDHLKGERRLIQEVTRPNALFLSVAHQHAHEQLKTVATWFLLIDTVNTEYSNVGRPTISILETPMGTALLPWLRDLLVKADVGITDLKVGKFLLKTGDGRGTETTTVLVRHLGAKEDECLPLKSESKGTKALFGIGWSLLSKFDFGGIMVVDELEASLHPKLAIEIIKQFNNPLTNPKNAQLIFTTHDTNLLGNDAGEPVLRRDQVWLTEKDKEGATVLYPLTDFKPRKPENLERGYLQGRYGAVPYLGNFSLFGEEAT